MLNEANRKAQQLFKKNHEYNSDHPHPLSGPVRDTPPYRAIPFRDSIAEGGIAPICLVFLGYRASIAEIPLWRGGIAPPLCMLSKGGNAQKRGRGYRTLLAML